MTTTGTLPLFTSPTMVQPELPLGGDAPNARTTDPISSHFACAAIRKNTTLADYIIRGVVLLSTAASDSGRLPVTDDDLLDYVEQQTRKRQQRNVIARARGLLERDGFFVRVPGDKVQVIPSPQLITQIGGNNE